MLNIRLQNNESIQIPRKHPIYMWSSVLQSKKEKNNPKLNLKKYSKNDLELVLRIVELVALSKNNTEFLKHLNVLSAAMNETQIKSALSLIHILNIVPTPEFIKNIPADYIIFNHPENTIFIYSTEQKLNIKTTKGDLQFSAYNYHNGYYYHDIIVKMYNEKEFKRYRPDCRQLIAVKKGKFSLL